MAVHKNAFERVAFSPSEFAALFGKSQTWGYRQIYAGKVKPVTEYGRLLIPAAEVDRILATAGIYDGLKKEKPPKTKAEIQLLAPKFKGAWQEYLSRRSPGDGSDSGRNSLAALAASRRKKKGLDKASGLARLAGRSNPKG